MEEPAAALYRRMVEATARQRARLHPTTNLSNRRDLSAPTFRFDPLRELEPNVEIIASYLRSADTVIEVGGGAGRVGLPLARRCSHLTNVEPSIGMGAQFRASATAAGIDNITLVPEPWPSSRATDADVVITEDVTYFVAEIEQFVAALQSAARRRVLIALWAVPPPNRNAALFELVFGERKAPVPGHAELVPVLWEMNILPDVRVLPEPFTWPETYPGSPEEAVMFALDAVEAASTPERTRRVEEALPRLFRTVGPLFRPAWRTDGQGLLITWTTGE